MKNAGHTKKPTNTLYPSLPEESKSHNPFCGVDPDLDSAPFPPYAPPPHGPPLNQDEGASGETEEPSTSSSTTPPAPVHKKEEDPDERVRKEYGEWAGSPEGKA